MAGALTTVQPLGAWAVQPSRPDSGLRAPARDSKSSSRRPAGGGVDGEDGALAALVDEVEGEFVALEAGLDQQVAGGGASSTCWTLSEKADSTVFADGTARFGLRTRDSSPA
ncbi:hypothetical protein DR950_00965 [Kitasatospora xanthocidica]|uniref:Uncharacterized protein n=1 Tax=Kitasatospora xanthocidica TaxID=83382 RepID=A0A372ZLW2_9ACTN|nr:hypothetical protein DR950_00965 [Kitasatospora xanthocidica]